MSTVDEAAGRPVPCGVSSSRFEDEDEGLAPAPITVSLRKGASREVGQRRPRRAASQRRGERFRVRGSGRCLDHCLYLRRMDRCLYRCRDLCRQ
jgi:hypothetical protein